MACSDRHQRVALLESRLEDLRWVLPSRKNQRRTQQHPPSLNVIMARSSTLGQAEHSLAKNVFLNLCCAAPDRAGEGIEIGPLPFPAIDGLVTDVASPVSTRATMRIASFCA